MPPRAQPKVYQLLIKTHKLTIFITASPSLSIASLKEEVLSALVSEVNQVEDVPKVTSEDDFEICKSVKDKGRSTGEYEVLGVSKEVKESNLVNWEILFLQFRDQSSGELLPVTFTPSTFDDEDEHGGAQAASPMDFTSPSSSKGKRKAHPE